jgi:hypothetical protein
MQVDMNEFLVKKTIETPQGDNVLELVSTEKLAVGKHRFSLQVEDGAGNVSTAATVTITVLDRTLPTAVLTVLDANKAPTETIELGSSFFLSAEGSTDIVSGKPGGEIAKYIWTLEG